MKVLFAVSSESISDAIVKKYQKEYKEILSYKNVYYFNAILKEIQKDKSYDRIVISEDLESFSNNNYEAIDKFIFEKLDDISDEAQDIDGNETSIILICADRHTKGSAFLVKIFGIGIYNALLGTERSMDNVCKLINKPRVKKEAKTYYKIDAEDVNYSNKSDNEVSELEIQNILTHFKKLGKNTEKYAESFNSIASQYTDNQLKIVVNCLPINVKAVLEEECQKYQELMSVNGVVQKVNSQELKSKEIKKQTGIKIDIIENKMNQAKISGPIVIPSSVRTSDKKKTASKPVLKTVEEEKQEEKKKVVKKVIKKDKPPVVQSSKSNEEEKPVYKTKVLPDGRVVRVKPKVKVPATPEVKQENVKRAEVNTKLSNDKKMPENLKNNIKVAKKAKIEEDDTVLPGLDDEEVVEEKKLPTSKKVKTKKVLPKSDDIEDDDILPGLDDTEEDDVLPGLDDTEENEDELPGLDNAEDEDDELPGLDDTEDEDELPGLDDAEEDEDELPGLDDTEEDEDELPGLDDAEEDEDELPGLDDAEEDDGELSELDDIEEDEDDEKYTDEVSLPGLDELDDLEDNNSNESDAVDEILPDSDEESEGEDLLFGVEDDEPQEENNSIDKEIDSIKPRIDYSMSSLNSLLTKDKKIVTFIGTTKNGTSFLINNLAALFSSLGISTAILDMTKNKNSYYIYTNNEEELRNIAYNSISKLQKGFAEGIKVNRNLSVYTALPNDGKDYSDAEPILSTLVQNHSLVLIDCDFDTDPSYFASCQEIYLVQSMDILTIQPLTAFLRDLKSKGVLESEKVRVVINKEIKVRSLTTKAIIGGMSFYNDPSMSFMTELFNKDMVKACSIPFEDNAYSKYLDSMVNCNVSINGYSKTFLSKLKNLGEMVYPLVGKPTYNAKPASSQLNYENTNFSGDMGKTLNKMKKSKGKMKF